MKISGRSKKDVADQALKEVHVHYVKQQVFLLNALKEKFGDEVADTVEAANAEVYRKAFEAIAGAAGDASPTALVQTLWEPLRAQRYEFAVEAKDMGLQITCTRCPLATLYRDLGGWEWGFRLYCSADYAVAEGFNPKIRLRRTKTLMEGHDCCDHFYYLKS